MSHFVIVCSCGTVIAQCRCIGPKIEQVREKACEKCRKKVSRDR